MTQKSVKLLVLSILFLLCPINSNSSFSEGSTTNRFDRITSILNEETEFAYLSNKIAELESKGKDWTVINNIGCMGLYQFKESTLRDLGFKVSLKEFRATPEVFPINMQNKALKAYLKYNERLLKKHIEKYAGKEIHGRILSKNQILAAAHFAGAGNVKKYFRTGKVSKDLYHSTLITYTKNI